MLKQRLETEGEHIIEIIGTTILPRVHHLSPIFLFPCLFEGFGESKEGKDAQDTARAAIAHVVADLKRRMTWALPRSWDPGSFLYFSFLFFCTCSYILT
jgi:hypothetical protein